MKAPAALERKQRGFLDDPGLQLIFDAIESAGGEVRVNGGAVRDVLLGEPPGDVDLSTTLEPPSVAACLAAKAIKAVATGIEHGTVTAVTNGKGYEITTLRRDIKTDGRRAVVAFGMDWLEDARRRDFTLNALYCDRRGRIFDPLGGYGDLVARKVRFIGDPRARIGEDHLRILRFFRFFAWYGQGRPDAEGLKACAATRELVAVLSVERVWQEVKKLLSAPDPARAALWMRTAGVLAAVLPESAKWGIDCLPAMVAAGGAFKLAPDPLLRLMAILPPRAEIVSTLAQRLKLSNSERERLLQWAQVPELALPGGKADLEILLYRQTGRAVIDRLLVDWARAKTYEKDAAAGKIRAQLIKFALAWRRPVLPVSGQDLVNAGLKPGPELGKELARLEERWIESRFRLSARELLEGIGKMKGD